MKHKPLLHIQLQNNSNLSRWYFLKRGAAGCLELLYIQTVTTKAQILQTNSEAYRRTAITALRCSTHADVPLMQLQGGFILQTHPSECGDVIQETCVIRPLLICKQFIKHHQILRNSHHSHPPISPLSASHNAQSFRHSSYTNANWPS
jgi:hypothetical protein